MLEDFYDYLIYKSLSKRAMKEIRLIGDILGQYRLGISDWWYASRIDKMIKDNKIKIVEDSDRKYTRIISIVRWFVCYFRNKEIITKKNMTNYLLDD